MAKGYQRRYTKGGRFSELGGGLRAALTQQQKFDTDQIQGLERRKESAWRVAKSQEQGLERSFSKEVSWSDKLQTLEDQIHNNKTRALNIRADRHVDQLKGEADELMRQSQMWSGIASSFGGALAKQAGNIYERIQEDQALKDFKPTDFTKENNLHAYAEIGLIEDMTSQGFTGEHERETWLNASVATTQKASNALGKIHVDHFIKNKNTIESVLRDTKVGKDNIFREQTVNDIYIAYARNYLRNKGIEFNSRAGKKLLEEVATWANSAKSGLKNKRLAEGTEANLIVQAELLGADLADVKSVASLDIDLRREELKTHFNLTVATAANGTIKDSDGNYISGLSPTEAAIYVVSKFKEQNPDLTREDIEYMLKNTKVPGIKRFKFDEKLFDKRYEAGEYDDLPGIEKIPKKSKAHKAFSRVYAVGKHKKELKSWNEVLTENGSLDVLLKQWDTTAERLKTGKEDKAKTQIQDDIKRIDRLTDPNAKLTEGEVFIDINDYSTGGGREQLWEIYNKKDTSEELRKHIASKYLDYDPQRQSTQVAVQNYQAALATLNYDDDSYYFQFLSDDDKEYYGASHKSISQLQKAGITYDGTKKKLKSFISTKYGDQFDSTKPNAELDAVTDHAAQRLNHYLHRLGDPGNPDYIEHPVLRYEKAEELVHADINEGIKDKVGVFAAQEIGRGGNLRLKWKNFSPGATKTNLKDVKNALTDLLGGTYDPDKVKNVVTAKEKFNLERMVVEGNARKFPLPENVIEVKRKFPNVPLRTIINDILMETKETDNMEVSIPSKYEWPAEFEEIIKSNSNTARTYNGTPPILIAYAQEIRSITGHPLMSDKMKEKLEGYVKIFQDKRYVTWQ